MAAEVVAEVVVGANGARAAGPAGWVAVRLRRGALEAASLHPSFAELLGAAADAAVVAVDIPIGHEQRDPRGVRACDAAARALLGPRAASVFPCPPPEVLAAPNHAAAVEVARARGWAAPSAQLWGLVPRIREVAALAARDPRIHEAHPEVAFGAMRRAHGAELLEPKRNPAGVEQRLARLAAEGLRPARVTGGVGPAPTGDVLDASACAWVARRIAAGEARTLPEAAPRDPATGRAVAIWC